MKNFKIKLCKFYTIFYYTPTKWQGCSPFGSSPPLLAKESYKVVLNNGTVWGNMSPSPRSVKTEKKVRNNVWKRKEVVWKSWKRK